MSNHLEAAVVARSMKLHVDSALKGDATVSLETQDLADSCVRTFIEGNFPEFLRIIQNLSDEDRDLLLGYYVLGKTQADLAAIHRIPPTICSSKIRAALQRVGHIIMNGSPTLESLKETFEVAGLEESHLGVPLSQVAMHYREHKSSQRAAELLGLHGPEVRRVMKAACEKLKESKNQREIATGAYLSGLIERASNNKRRVARRKLARSSGITIKTPAILGQFRVDVTDPDFDQLFTPSGRC
jgi:DNA-directed RNA polymerase specialized sigma24 family protein